MSGIFNRIKKWFSSKDDSISTTESGVMLIKLLTAVDKTEEIEYDCSEVYNLIDQYAEMIQNGENADELMPLVKHHLEMCIACKEEFESLMRILENSPLETN